MSTNTTPVIPLSHFTTWLASGERGISSEAIVSQLTGQQVGRPWRGSDYPHDPADFRRCQLLLESHPLARLVFPSAMRARSAVWARLADAWDEIHEAIEADVPGYVHDSRPRGSARRGYLLMRRIIANGVSCAACDGTGHASACDACKGSGRRGGGRCRARGCYGGHHYCQTCRGNGYTGGDA